MLTIWVSSPSFSFCFCAARELLSCFCADCELEGSMAMSPLLLTQDELRGGDIEDEKNSEYEQVGPKIVQAKCLRKGPNAYRLVPSRREDEAQHPPATRKG